MATIILYASDNAYVDKTLDEFFDKTSRYILEEVLVCDDNECGIKDDRVKVLKTDSIGPAAAFNAAIEESVSETVILFKGCIKLKDDWVNDILPKVGEIRTPITYVLEPNHWAMQDMCMRRYGFRWDLSYFDRPDPENPETPVSSPVCMAFKKKTFNRLGKFDENLRPDESGEFLEFSIRAWMSGVGVVVAEKSRIAAPELPIPTKHNNSARIVEQWFDSYSSNFYERQGITANDCHVGKLADVSDRKLSADDYLRSKMPELLGAYRLRGAASGKSVAIVGTGPSTDFINPAMVYRHDIVIGVDYMGMLFNCDYMTTFDSQIVVALRERYLDPNFILPIALHDRTASKMVAASSIANDPIICELAREGDSISTIHPPFINYDNAALFATHIALFLGAKSVTLFGVDNKIIGGRSHSSKIDYYDDGKVWADNDAVRREFARYEFGLDMLGRLANSINVPVLRVNHV